jgi:carbon monoxide dehydrogenase subunit G
MLRFEGTRDFPQPLAVVWGKLTDPSFLVTCIPDVESVRECTADSAALVLRPNLAFVRGTLDVSLRFVEAVAPAARLLLASKGVGSSSLVEATLGFEALGEGTRVRWTAEVKELGGLLKLAPHGLIRGAAERVVNQAWEAIGVRLGAPA